MGRRNAFTFAKRQRELEKKKKKEAKRLARAQRKQGIDPDLESAEEPLDPDAPAPAEEEGVVSPESEES